MKSEFQKRNINSLCSLLSSGGTPSRNRDDYYQNGKIKWLKTKELLDTNIYETEEHITELGLKNSSAKLYPSNTVVMAMYGATVGQLGIMKTEMSTNQACCCMVVNDEIADYKYLFYSLLNNRNQLVGLANGAAQQNLNSQTIKDFEILVPPLPTQKKIAHILSTLDDKIELNRNMNQTLESMASAMFKSWFVDFDPVHAKANCEGEAELENIAKELGISKAILELFPSEFIESELGMIPKGWEVNTLSAYLTIKRGSSPRPIQDYLVKNGLPWVKIADATASNSPFLFFTKECIKEEGLKKTVLLKKGSLILSNSATPGLPKILDIDACIHDGWLHFPTKKLFSNEYLYLLFLELRKEFISKGNGSVFTNLKTDILREQNVIIPSVNILKQFNQTVSIIFSTIKNNEKNINSLSNIRDTLLPKLLSGEIDVSELKI